MEIDPEGVVWVESRCRRSTQCFDWGKNQRNVKVFLELLDEKARQIGEGMAGWGSGHPSD